MLSLREKYLRRQYWTTLVNPLWSLPLPMTKVDSGALIHYPRVFYLSSSSKGNKKSLCGSVGKDFINYVCSHKFESRLKRKFSNFPHHLYLLLSDYRGMAKWFGAQYYQEVRFSSTVMYKKGPQVLTSLRNQRQIIIIMKWTPEHLYT